MLDDEKSLLFRLNLDSRGGGAWCPSRAVSNSKEDEAEYLQIDLGGVRVVTHILTQGRFGSGRGQEYAEAYTVQYWRRDAMPEGQFRNYRDSMGREVRKIILGMSSSFTHLKGSKTDKNELYKKYSEPFGPTTYRYIRKKSN